MNILEVKNLSIGFGGAEVVKDVSFDVEKGRIMALVGESGCGKSLSCLALTRLVQSPPAVFGGVIRFFSCGEWHSMLEIPERKLRALRGGGIAYIFQEPSSSLNPVLTVFEQIAEALRLHRPEVEDFAAETVELLRQVGIPAPETRLKAYPHELSGGMQQRVMIAMALACSPELLVADEPTTALDVTIQAQILELLSDLRAKHNMTIILVTHNLGIVAELADAVTVMYAGNVVESASSAELFACPRHPYTAALLNAVPKLGGGGGRLVTIPGAVPSPENFPAGCRFFGRCLKCGELTAAERKMCENVPPPVFESPSGHRVRCHFAGDIAGGDGK
ncbi:MAG: ABC transporter ATP-binding protein [Victivallaceae bacterium]|nr:ABC transporter ATP-binding protein [Victivallaceae bacterium]